MTFRSSSNLAGSGGPNAAVPVPAGAQSGDIAVVGIYKENANAITPPSGFTQKAALATGATSRGSLYVFWKRLTAADTGTWSFTFTGTDWRAAAAGLWSGRATSGDPFDGTPGTGDPSTGNATTLAVSTSPAGAGGDAVGFWTNWQGGNTYTPPTNYTERVDIDVICMDTRDNVASGSTGSISAASNVSGPLKAFLGVLAVAGGSTASGTAAATATAAITASATVLASSDSSGSATTAATVTASATVVSNATATRTTTASLQAAATGPERFITQILGSGNQQYTADQVGDPILVKGDVIWAFPANAGRWNSGDWQGDITDYLDIRQAQGFNLLMFGALGSTQNGGPADTGATFDGILPFSGGNGVLNSTYWTRVDYIVDQAAIRGITVLMNVAYSYDMDSASLQSFSNANYTTYGTNLGNRYKTATNLIWGFGGDYFDTQQTQLGNLFTAVQATGDTHMISGENYPETTSRKDLSNNSTQNTGVTWSDWNFVYSYNVTYFGVEYAFGETSPICVIWGDGHFDQDSTPDRTVLRNDIWWALSSGARGHIYGSEGTWNWQSGALSNTSSEAFPSTYLATIWTAFTGWAGWHQLVPDTDSSFVTAGRGTRASGLTSGGGGGEYNSSDTQDTYVTASVTPDGTLAVVYTPVAHTITVNDTELGSGYTVTKVDPTNGATSSVTPSSTYALSGTNALGGTDWLLVFQSAGGTTQTATGTLTETPVLTAAAAVARPATGALTATAAASASAGVTTGASGTAAVSITVSAAAQTTNTATASLTGTATIAASATVVSAASANVTTTAALTATANVGLAPVTATGTAVSTAVTAAAAGVTTAATATAATTATVAAAAGVATSGTATLTTTATPSAAAAVDAPATGTQATTAALSASASVSSPGSAQGSLTATTATTAAATVATPATGATTTTAAAQANATGVYPATASRITTLQITAAASIDLAPPKEITGVGVITAAGTAAAVVVQPATASRITTLQITAAASVVSAASATRLVLATATAAAQGFADVTERPYTGTTIRPYTGTTYR